jgi:hypothetical protein
LLSNGGNSIASIVIGALFLGMLMHARQFGTLMVTWTNELSASSLQFFLDNGTKSGFRLFRG